MYLDLNILENTGKQLQWHDSITVEFRKFFFEKNGHKITSFNVKQK